MVAHWLARLLCACAIVVALFDADAACAESPPIHVETRREGEVIVVEARADLRARPAVAWEVLTDYDHYADFVPDLSVSRIVERAKDALTVEQRGEARFLFFRFPLEVRLAVTEEPFHTVRCKASSGSFRQLDGVYRLLPASDGVVFAYSGRIVPAFRLPPLIGIVAVRSSIERQFDGLVREIVRRSERAGDAGR